jgi:tetratricopeptide (TPR) repeat protein
MPVDVLVSTAEGEERLTLKFAGPTADFVATLRGGQPTLTVDPDRKILRSSDAIRTAVVVRRGIEEMEQDRVMDAEAHFKDAIRLSPRSSWAWYNLGLLYMKQRNAQKAIDAFSQALSGDLEPRWLEVWSYVRRGMAYDASGERDRAVAEYNKAAESGDDYAGAQAEARRYLGEAYRF